MLDLYELYVRSYGRVCQVKIVNHKRWTYPGPAEYALNSTRDLIFYEYQKDLLRATFFIDLTNIESGSSFMAKKTRCSRKHWLLRIRTSFLSNIMNGRISAISQSSGQNSSRSFRDDLYPFCVSPAAWILPQGPNNTIQGGQSKWLSHFALLNTDRSVLGFRLISEFSIQFSRSTQRAREKLKVTAGFKAARLIRRWCCNAIP